MTGYCEIDGCHKRFDSHDGGALCQECGIVACPGCQDDIFEEGETTCRKCRAAEKAAGSAATLLVAAIVIGTIYWALS